MYVVYCQNKPKSEHIVSEYIETYFEVSRITFYPPSQLRLISVFVVKGDDALKILLISTS